MLTHLIASAILSISMLIAPTGTMTDDPIVERPDISTQDQVTETSETKFRRALLNVAAKAVKDGKMKRADMIRLRVATLSPAFCEQAEDLAVIQMSASGSDNVPLTPDGAVDRGSINWEGLAAFLERLLPLILELIKALSSIDSIHIYVGADGSPLFAVIQAGGNVFTVAA